MPPAAARWAWAAALAACVATAGWLSVAAGLDVNWDLKNYHYYDPFAFLEGRIAWDVAPAQIQTYHNPLADLAFYTLVREIPSPRIVAAAMALPAGIAAFLLLRMLVALFPAGTAGRWAWIAAAFAVGMTGASGQAVLGTTMNEWLPAMLLMAGLTVIVESIARRGPASVPALALGGLAAGLAMGLKLTYGIFALALVVSAAMRTPWRAGFSAALASGFAVLAGLAITYGFWGAILWREFANPFFPYFNDVFRSPWYEPVAWLDRNFGPRGALQAIFFPFYFSEEGSRLAGELPFRDWRLATLMALAILVLARRCLDRARAPAEALVHGNAWRFLGAFAFASYLAWIGLFGIYRYLVPLEMLSGVLIVGSILYLVRARRVRALAVILAASLLVATTQKPDWGHLPFRGAYFDVAVPEILPRALVIVGPFDPMAYAIPFFRHDARFVSPSNNFLELGQRNLLARRAAGLIASHPGPLYCLDVKPFPRVDPVLAHFGLVREPGSCLGIRSYLDDSSLQVCRLARVALYDSASARSKEGGKR